MVTKKTEAAQATKPGAAAAPTTALKVGDTLTLPAEGPGALGLPDGSAITAQPGSTVTVHMAGTYTYGDVAYDVAE